MHKITLLTVLVTAFMFVNSRIYANSDYYTPDKETNIITKVVYGNVNINFYDAYGVYKDDYENIYPEMIKVVRLVNEHLSFNDMTINVQPSVKLVVPDIGVGGISKGSKRIDLYFNPHHIEYPKNIIKYFPRVVAHELFHSLHDRNVQNGYTLIDASVREGMADRFALDILKLPLAPWSSAFGISDMPRVMNMACKEFKSNSWNHKLWFSGRNNLSSEALDYRENEVPKWAGYTIGLYLVDEYIKNSGITSFSQLIKIKPEDFLSPEMCTNA